MDNQQEQAAESERVTGKGGIPPIHQLAKKIRALTNDRDVAKALRWCMDEAVWRAFGGFASSIGFDSSPECLALTFGPKAVRETVGDALSESADKEGGIFA